jgi:translocation and assembly module TamB
LPGVGPIRDIDLTLLLTDRTVKLAEATLTIGGSTVIAAGEADLSRSGWLTNIPPPFEFVLFGTNVPLSRQPDSILRSDLNLSVKKTNGAPPLISGSVRLRDSYYLSDLSDLVPGKIATPEHRPPYFSVSEPGLADWRLALRVAGERGLKVRSTLFNGQVSPNLRVQGTLKEPIALGDVKIENGTVKFPFATLDLQRGYVTLTSEDPYRPHLMVSAASKKFGYDIRMELTGPADQPVIQFNSTPPLSSEQLVLMLTAGELPKGGYTLTPSQRAQTMALFLGKDLLAKLGFGDQSEERLSFSSGQEISETGKPTYSLRIQTRRPLESRRRIRPLQRLQRRVQMETLLQMTCISSISRRPPSARFASLLLTVFFLLFEHSCPAAAGPKEKITPAKLKVSGYGLIGNYELKRILRTLELSGKKPQYFGPAFIEDSALILSSRVKKDGYLKPQIQIRLQLRDGTWKTISAQDLAENPLPRSLLATRAEFRIRKGLLYHYQQLEFEGLKSMTDKQARSYFMETATLLHPKSARVYTPEKLKQGLSSLIDILERDGYGQATVETNRVTQDDKTGHVFVKIRVDQGPKSIVDSVRESFFYEKDTEPATNRIVTPRKPYSRVWAQDFSQALKTNLFHRGYPDTSVELTVTNQHSDGNLIHLDLEAAVKSGPHVNIGVVDFSGEKRTKEKTMARRVKLKPGEPLDRIKVEEGRYRLTQLGSFDVVDSIYQPVDDHTRDVLYRVKEGKELEISLLFGYGSYELLRGGLEIERNNIWGLGPPRPLESDPILQSFERRLPLYRPGLRRRHRPVLQWLRLAPRRNRLHARRVRRRFWRPSLLEGVRHRFDPALQLPDPQCQ